MANVGVYAQKAMLDWVLGGATPTRPGGRWLGLSLGTPSSTSASEASFGSYSRQTLAFSAATSPGGSALNSVSAVFRYSSTAGSSVVVGWQIWDTNLSSGSGNMLWYGTFTAISKITSASPLTVPVGSLIISMS